MERGITWYDILGVLPGASPDEIRQAYDAKASLLRPELISGAPSKVLVAASRAEKFLGAALRVLGDPPSRERYDVQSGGHAEGSGLSGPESSPTEPGWRSSDFDLAGGHPEAELLGAMMALTDWLAPHPSPTRRLAVPDVRGAVLQRVPGSGGGARSAGDGGAADPASDARRRPGCRSVAHAAGEDPPGR